jgi:hypothetical protein
MSGRADYHRAYYWRSVEARRATARALAARRRLVRRWTRLLGEAVDEARQEKKSPPLWVYREGFTDPGVMGYPFIAVNGLG